jgi:hypothetical protein
MERHDHNCATDTDGTYPVNSYDYATLSHCRYADVTLTLLLHVILIKICALRSLGAGS